jgi:hypothetical protein
MIHLLESEFGGSCVGKIVFHGQRRLPLSVQHERFGRKIKFGLTERALDKKKDPHSLRRDGGLLLLAIY